MFVVNDALTPVLRTCLDLHFGRVCPLCSAPDEQGAHFAACRGLVRHIAQHFQKKRSTQHCDAAMVARAMDRESALPRWLVNKAIVACENDRTALEGAVCDLLREQFNARRFFDYVCGELLLHCWDCLAEDEKRHWIVHRCGDARDNTYCMSLNSLDFVLKLDGNVIEALFSQEDVFRWYVKSIGSVCLLRLTSKSVYAFTSKLIETKYKTQLISSLFHKLFARASQAAAVDRHGVLVLGEIPKAFGLRDYLSAVRPGQSRAAGGEDAEDIGALELFADVLDSFDGPGACQGPDSRFRMGDEPPQAVAERVAALYWLRRTLDAAKAIQSRKAAATRGLRVEELSGLLAALKQKSILYFRLCDDPDDLAISPCHLKAVGQDTMTVQSPRGNHLNAATPGQMVHGSFSIVGPGRRSTYLDFQSAVRRVTVGGESHVLVELGLPEAFELTRRSHQRLRLDPSQLGAFELCAPAPEADWARFGSLEKWPAPFCFIPDSASLCQLRDLSAGGLMLEIHRDAPAYEYFLDRNKDDPLLALMHLTGRGNVPDLKLGLRLAVKRIRDFPPLRKKYVGCQFLEAGEVRQDRLVRFTPVGKDGIFLINDWIFRNSIGR